MQTWWELGKALAKTALLVAVAWPAVTAAMHTLTGGADASRRSAWPGSSPRPR